MTIESIENEASIQADQLEEKQILGIYDNEISAYYDDGWNSGKVIGFEEGFIEGAKWVLENLEKENEQKFDDSNRAWKELVKGWVVDYRSLEEENEQLKAQVKTMINDDLKGLSDIHKYAHKLFKAFNSLDFKSNYNYALQAFYLEGKLYVVRSKVLNDYQYTLVEADSEEQAIRKCF